MIAGEGGLPLGARRMLQGAVDYAGLFPPAALPMPEAVRAYAGYLASEDAWALGRFVLPSGRLGEFAGEVGPLLPRAATVGDTRPWRLSVLAGATATEERARVESFNAQWQRRLVIDAVEAKVARADDIAGLAPLRAPGCTLYVECPLGPGVEACVAAVGGIGACAKVRTGGVTADAFPSPAILAQFILACAERRVPFKATAGLHHPLRAAYRLTYEAGADEGIMFGFVNVILAAALAQSAAPASDVAALLDERDAAAIRFVDDAVTWRGYRIPFATPASERTLMRGFGSCSFREPMDGITLLASLSHG